MIDVEAHIENVERRVGSTVLAAGEARVVTVSRVYDTTVDDLWDACTNAERIPRWFLPISGDLRVGGTYQLEGNAGGTIEACDPPRSFRATWEYGGDVSWIEVTVTPEGEARARFRLEHIAHVDDERWLEFGPGAVGVGWDMAVLGLSLHLASGKPEEPVDQAAVQEWLMTDEGRALLVAASESWRDADIASGTDPTAAADAAARTAAAYTATE